MGVYTTQKDILATVYTPSEMCTTHQLKVKC